jgi:T5SS/PEP-CTERM-associated repeat protein/autotransporter-associated beta strand protein
MPMTSQRLSHTARTGSTRPWQAALIVALLSLPGIGFSQTVWTGGAGDWFAAGNWSDGVPGPATQARISNSGTAEITSSGAAAQSLFLGFDVPDFGNLTASGAGTLTVAADLSVGYGGTGALHIADGATVSANSSQIGYTIFSETGVRGDAIVDGAGSTWNNAFELYVGYGTGTLSITNGGTVSDFFGYLGYFAEFPGHSHGTATVDGVGSTWTHGSDFHVGDSGTGVLNISNGGAVSNGTGYLGFNFGSDGTASVDGPGSSWTTNGFFYVGNNGDGVLDVTDGGLVVSNGSFAYLAFHSASTASATIDGADSLWSNANGLYIGFGGEGTLNIVNGGAMESGFFANVGFSPGATGTIAVSGSGSRFANAGTLAIGGNVGGPGGTGIVRIEDGGSVSAAAVNVWSSGTLEIGQAPTLQTNTLMFDGGTLRAVDDTSFDNDATLGAGGVVLDSNGFNATLAGVFSGTGGLIKRGAGTMTLAGVNSYEGDTSIEAGSLLLADGHIASPVVVDAGATLAGSGVFGIGGGTSTIEGTLAPAQTLSVDGNLAFGAAATTHFAISQALAGAVLVEGTAALGGQLVVDIAGGMVPGAQYTLVQADGGLNGSVFFGVSINVPPGSDFGAQVTYDANHVYLVIVQQGTGLTIAPDNVDFGTVPAGITVGPATITVTSSGVTPAVVNDLTTAAAPFARTGGDCPPVPFELAPSVSCTLAYTFMPTRVGAANQVFAIASNAGTHTFALSGTGIAGIPSTLVVLGGDGQSAAVGTSFAAPLAVQVRDDWNNPVPNIPVTFAAPGSGASAVLSAGSVTTDANGYAAVNAIANAQVGSYAVGASGGIGAPVAFALSNLAAVADVSVGIAVDRDDARAGQLLNYVVTLHNGGPNAATGAAIASTLSPLLDADAASWICLGPSQSGCTQAGQGDLIDSGLSLPSGASVSYLVSAPVRIDVDGTVETSAHASLAGDPDADNDTAMATTAIVLFRDGFELYGDGSDVPLTALPDPVTANERLVFAWPAGVDAAVERLLVAADSASMREAFRLERIGIAATSRARLVATDAVGVEHAGAWTRIDEGAALAFTLLQTGGQERVALLIGRGVELQLPLAATPASYRVWTAASLQATRDASAE